MGRSEQGSSSELPLTLSVIGSKPFHISLLFTEEGLRINVTTLFKSKK